jgi:hypothetical protein
MLGGFLFWIKPYQKLDKAYRHIIGGGLKFEDFPFALPQHKIWPKLFAKNPIHYLLKTTSFPLGFKNFVYWPCLVYCVENNYRV